MTANHSTHKHPEKILLIGATSGMGRTLDLRYAEQGDIVGIAGRRQELPEQIRALYPDGIHFCAYDMRSMEHPSKLSGLVHQMDARIHLSPERITD